MMVASTFQAGFDGAQRIDIRCWLLICGAGVELAIDVLLAPRYGLVGIAYGRVAQNTVVLVASWFLLKSCLTALPKLPCRWRKELFLEMIGYGANFQIASIASMLCEPTTKALLSRFSGLAMAGYYEMASRMVTQLRTVLASAVQVIVPGIAELQETAPGRIAPVYRATCRLVAYIGLPLFTLIVASAPLVSELWIGRYEPSFIFPATVLAAAWFFNILGLPAYFTYLGTGELRWNVMSHVVAAALNVVVGLVLGMFYGGVGVIVAWGAALALGSSIQYLSYHRNYNIPLGELIPENERAMAVACVSRACAAVLLYHMPALRDGLPVGSMGLLVFLALAAVPFWRHPMRGQLTGLIRDNLLRTGQAR